ncbi:MAG: hypothetical protein ACI88C_000036 [Acidimicrobiales bacterium]|jgi:hypothetical protein
MTNAEELPNMQARAEQTVSELAKTAPHWICLLLLSSSFLWYLDRKDAKDAEMSKREDLVAVQRIEQCHDVQKYSVEVMGRLSESLSIQSAAFVELTSALRLHMKHLETKIDKLIERLPRDL